MPLRHEGDRGLLARDADDLGRAAGSERVPLGEGRRRDGDARGREARDVEDRGQGVAPARELDRREGGRGIAEASPQVEDERVVGAFGREGVAGGRSGREGLRHAGSLGRVPPLIKID